MGKLIAFPLDRVQHTMNIDMEKQETATILVFEGVRYFREDQDNGPNLKISLAKPHS